MPNIPLHVHDYSVSRLRNKAVGRAHLVGNFVDEAVMLTFVLYHKQNKCPTLSSDVLGGSCSLETVSKEAVADTRPTHLLFGWHSPV